MTIRVHHYVERDGLSVCKHCGVVENKDATGPRWCAGKTPKIGLRDAGNALEVRLTAEQIERIVSIYGGRVVWGKR